MRDSSNKPLVGPFALANNNAEVKQLRKLGYIATRNWGDCCCGKCDEKIDIGIRFIIIEGEFYIFTHLNKGVQDGKSRETSK